MLLIDSDSVLMADGPLTRKADQLVEDWILFEQQRQLRRSIWSLDSHLAFWSWVAMSPSLFDLFRGWRLVFLLSSFVIVKTSGM